MAEETRGRARRAWRPHLGPGPRSIPDTVIGPPFLSGLRKHRTSPSCSQGTLTPNPSLKARDDLGSPVLWPPDAALREPLLGPTATGFRPRCPQASCLPRSLAGTQKVLPRRPSGICRVPSCQPHPWVRGPETPAPSRRTPVLGPRGAEQGGASPARCWTRLGGARRGHRDPDRVLEKMVLELGLQGRGCCLQLCAHPAAHLVSPRFSEWDWPGRRSSFPQPQGPCSHGPPSSPAAGAAGPGASSTVSRKQPSGPGPVPPPKAPETQPDKAPPPPGLGGTRLHSPPPGLGGTRLH